MGDFDGLMVPRQVHAAELSHEERALVWTLLIESGHIPLRTMLGTCNRDLYRPLRRVDCGFCYPVNRSFTMCHPLTL